MKRYFNSFVIAVITLMIYSCNSGTEVAGTIQYEVPQAGYLPDAGAEVYTTQENVDAIKELIDATDKNVFLWRMKEASGWEESRYAEFEEKAGITHEKYQEAYSKGLQRILDLKAPVLKNEKVVKTTADASGQYSIKLKGNNWNIVYISKNLNPEGTFYYVDIKILKESSTDKKNVDVKFDPYKFEFFR